MNPLLVIGGMAGIILIYLIFSYNRLVALRNHRLNSWADIDVQLKQRYDLIPQLVESVKAYVKHEDQLLVKVTEARSQAMSASTLNEKMQADQNFSQAWQGLKVSLESYPDLKANQNFLQLQGEISDLENKLAASRRYFNSTTREFNTAIQSFPSNLVAKMFSFAEEKMFDLAEQRAEMDKTPHLNF
ncbi:MAG TPA: LemA family protein [Candidatus Gracilibacteria bacterium]|nr:LemA family protein [Candidatus Gracilibacteria bacterium]